MARCLLKTQLPQLAQRRAQRTRFQKVEVAAAPLAPAARAAPAKALFVATCKVLQIGGSSRCFLRLAISSFNDCKGFNFAMAAIAVVVMRRWLRWLPSRPSPVVVEQTSRWNMLAAWPAEPKGHGGILLRKQWREKQAERSDGCLLSKVFASEAPGKHGDPARSFLLKNMKPSVLFRDMLAADPAAI